MSVYDVLFERVLTRVDPERAHHLGFAAIRTATPLTRQLCMPRNADQAQVHRHGRRPGTSAPADVLGMSFPSRLGLAAGFDKNAVGIDALAALGFGFVEIGTVTARPQPGNPKPRLFRLPADRAIVNRMGFNNDGAEVVARRLEARSRAFVPGRRRTTRTSAGSALSGMHHCRVGVNIGKTKVVPEDDEQAVLDDYVFSARLLAPYADYLVVNVSSPNTPGLRSLQAVERLGPLLEAVRRVADDSAGRHVPLLVKIAPDLDDADVNALAGLAVEIGLDGVVATNTTVARTGLATGADEVERIGAGGLSGPPLRDRSRDVLARLRKAAPDLALVAAGGIDSAEEARVRLDAGADLVQAYTAFVYGGPLWPRRVARGLRS